MSEPFTRVFDHVAIRASAGTGKTFQLTNRFLGLLAAGESPSRILATTFTRKAAGEILDRVLRRLAAAALDPAACRELAGHINSPGLTPLGAGELLAGLARSLHRVQVGTLDSFFASIAGGFALELGLSPSWRIVEPVVEKRMRSEAIRAVLEADPSKLVELMRRLNKDYADRSVHEKLDDLVAGLYRVYVETPAQAWRLPRLSEDLLPPDRLREAVERLAGLGPEDLPRNKDGSTPKRWVSAIRGDAEAARRHDWLGLIEDGIGAKVAAGAEVYSSKPIEGAVLGAYEPLVRHARAALMDRLADETEAMRELMRRFDGEFARLRRRHHALRFEDVTRALGRAGAYDWPGSGEGGESAVGGGGGGVMERLEEVYYRLDARVAHLLLDEFQDTSPAQWRVLAPIAEEVAAHGDGERSLLCVGDVKQAIYGWRGGEAGLFDTLHAQLPALRVQPLNRSFRSAQPVIDVVNRVFGSIADNPAMKEYRDAAEAWAEGFEEHTTARGELRGYVRMETGPRADKEAGEDQERETLRRAARRVKQIVRDSPGGSVGVLLRRNNRGQIARMIHDLGRDEDGGALPGVRASEEGGNPLTDSPAAMLVLSLLKLADHPGDSAARFHVAASPLGPAVGLGRFDDDRTARRVARRVRAGLVERGYGPMVRGWADRLRPCCDRRERMRLTQLVQFAYGYDSEATLRPGDFVRAVESRRVEDPAAAAVRVMTVHQAKGLQFDAVVLGQLDGESGRLTGRPPTVVVDKPPGAMEAAHVCAYANEKIVSALPPLEGMFARHEAAVVREALCVLYVAATRAVHELHVLVAPCEKEKCGRDFAGVFRGALTDGSPLEPGAVCYEHGEPAGRGAAGADPPPSGPRGERASEKGREDGAVPPGAAHASRPVARFAGPGQPPARLPLARAERRMRGLPRRSPSALAGGDRVHLAARMALGGGESRAHGSAIHALLERIEWLDQDEVADESELRAVIRRAAGRAVKGSVVLHRYREILAYPAIRRLLSRASHPPDADLRVLREQRFALRLGETMLSGAFDRLVLTMRGDRPVGAELIDFKTDQPDGGAGAGLERVVERYRPQVEAYRRAAARLYKLDPGAIRARLAFVSLGEVREVEAAGG